MRRLSHSRLATLDAWLRPRGEPVGRLLFLIPDLWPEADQEVFRAPRTQKELSEVVERALVSGRSSTCVPCGQSPCRCQTSC